MRKVLGHLAFSIFLIVGCLTILPGGTAFWGHEVPAVSIYVILLFGIALAVSSAYTLFRNRHSLPKAKGPEYTDNDVLNGLKELERQYVKQYGKLPDYHGSLKETMNEDKEKL